MLTNKYSHITSDMVTKLDLASSGEVLTPDTPGYDQARMNWNVYFDQHPMLIVVAQNTNDIVEAIRFANTQNLKVAVKSTGHGVVVPANDCLLVVTSKMKGIEINVEKQTARIEAGVLWAEVLERAQQSGLAPLLGSSPNVGVMGYTLGGGIGWLARKHGLALDSVVSFDVVTPSGDLIPASEDENPDLYWALRGGGGNFGVVTSMEIRLYPVSTIYGGNLYYPISMAREIYRRYRAWAANAPEELTSSVVIMNYPPIPQMPEFLRGQTYIQIRGCYAGPVEEGERLMTYWRDWQAPIVDDFKARPFTEVALISNDPVDPMPAGVTGAWMREINDEVIDTLCELVPPAGGPPVVMFAEIRHAGGAVAESHHAGSAFSLRNAEFLLELIGLTPGPEVRQAFDDHCDEIKRRLSSSMTGGVYMNFVEGDEARRRSKDGFSADAYARLKQMKAAYDPDNRFCHSFDLSAD